MDARARVLFGIAPEETLTRDRWLEAIHPDDRVRALERWEQAVAERAGYSTEYRVVWPDGSAHALMSVGRCVTDPATGVATRFSGVVLDLTERRRTERVRVDFVANASHELRTPLSTILGYAETLAEEGEQPEELRTRFGSTIREEAQRMLRIIEDLMSLSRIEADRFLAPADEVPIDDVIETAVASAGHARNGNQCEFVVDIPGDLPKVRGDRAQLEQVFDNLIGNAVRYGCDGSRSKVEVGAKRDGSSIAVSVTDHGPGIPREHLPRVTERFYRVEAARSRESGGTGLGLAIVKHIVERHRGTLEIKSVLGEGTSVTVKLPAAA
jgi:two-component system phosphate regulon sensor histidine kinase PhoR